VPGLSLHYVVFDAPVNSEMTQESLRVEQHRYLDASGGCAKFAPFANTTKDNGGSSAVTDRNNCSHRSPKRVDSSG
jgi:hypothetical protein